MCAICGCDAHAPDPATGVLHHGAGPAGLSPLRAIQLEADVLGANKRQAARNRAHFAAHGVTAYNLLSSPGSGKTTLLCATIEALQSRTPAWPLAVIEGDQQTSLDAERIRATGAPAIQVNTGRGCHLDARMVGDAFERLDLHTQHAHPADHAHHDGENHHGGQHSGALLFIENVGNLVCPALWDLGEAAKVVVLSVTEGEDKPLKYPDMFAVADLVLVNKVDLAPHLDFDVKLLEANIQRVRPGVKILRVSAKTGDGFGEWLGWLKQGVA